MLVKSDSNLNMRNIILIRLREKQIFGSLVALSKQTIEQFSSGTTTTTNNNNNNELKVEL